MAEEYRKWLEEQRKELEEIDKRKEELDRKVLEWETQEELINIIIKLQKKNLNLSVGIDLLNNKIDELEKENKSLRNRIKTIKRIKNNKMDKIIELLQIGVLSYNNGGSRKGLFEVIRDCLEILNGDINE